MKKVLISLAALCLMVALPAQAQIKFGIKAGANISSLSGDKNAMIDEIKNAANYHAGLLVQYNIGNFAIQPEVLLSTQGAELVNDGTSEALNFYSAVTGESVPNTFTLKTTYLEVPVNLQYGINVGGMARVYVQAGPYASLLLADEMEGTESFYEKYKEYAGELSQDGGIAQFVNKFDYGVGVGAGIEVLFMQLSVKYDFSLAEFQEITSKIGNVDMNLMSGLKNRNLNISLAFMF